MISAPITALYAALSGLLILVLAGLVSRHRMQTGIVLGDGGHEPCNGRSAPMATPANICR